MNADTTTMSTHSVRSTDELSDVNIHAMDDAAAKAIGSSETTTSPAITVIDCDIDIDGPKEGARYYGICCDMRRAVIVVNILAMCHTIFKPILFFIAWSTVEELEDESIQHLTLKTIGIPVNYSAVDKIPGEIFLTTFIGIGILLCCGIVGAVKYNTKALSVAAIWHVLNTFIFDIMELNTIQEFNDDNAELFSYVSLEYGKHLQLTTTRTGLQIALSLLITAALILYPHLVLIREIQKGVMSAETYPREQRSCCAV